MKVLLVRPNNTEAFSLFAGAGGQTIPLGIAYIAAVLKRNGIEVKILDHPVENLDDEGVKNYIKNYQPDIIGITTTTPDIYNGFKIAEIAKKLDKDILVLMGGPHATAVPEETLKNENVDVVVIGEGEYSILELVKAVENKTSFKEIKGIYYKPPHLLDINSHLTMQSAMSNKCGGKENNQVIFTGYRELIKNLDEIPFPARELLDMDKYTLSATRKRIKGKADAVITGRGCPFNCNFCSKKVFGQSVRFRSAENIVAEIELIMNKYNVKEISFVDDAFTVNRNHVLNVCNLLIKKKINITWGCHSRVDGLNEELIKLMRRAGCRSIAFGIESGSQKILDLIGKRITLDQVKKAIALTKKYRIISLCGFILGHPGDTRETVMETLKFARELNPSFANFYILVPLPGSRVFEMAKERCLIDDKHYDKFTALSNQKPVIQMSELTPDELIYYQKLGYRMFYFRPKYILRKILEMKSSEDIKQGWRGLKVILKHQLHKYIK